MDQNAAPQENRSHGNLYNDFDFMFTQLDGHLQPASHANSFHSISTSPTPAAVSDDEDHQSRQEETFSVDTSRDATRASAQLAFTFGFSSMASGDPDAQPYLAGIQTCADGTDLPQKPTGSGITGVAVTEPLTSSLAGSIENVHMTGTEPVLSSHIRYPSYNDRCAQESPDTDLHMSQGQQQEEVLCQPLTWSSCALMSVRMDLENLSLNVAPTTAKTASSNSSRASSNENIDVLDMVDSRISLSVHLGEHEDKIEWWSDLLPLDSSEYDNISTQHLYHPPTRKNPELHGAAIERDPVGTIYDTPDTWPYMEEPPLSLHDGTEGTPLDYSDDFFGRRSVSSYGGDANLRNDQSAGSYMSNASAHSSQSAYSRSLLGPRQGRRRTHRTSARSRATSLSSGMSSTGSDQPSISRPSFECPTCGSKFTRKSTLTRHHNATHAFKDTWICQAVVYNNISAGGLQGLSNDDFEGQHGCPICLPNMPCAHDMRRCMMKPEIERTYYRLDGFKQHLQIVHGFNVRQLRTLQLAQWYREAVPREAVPREAVPREAVPREAVPREAVPREAVPREAVPREAVPREAVPREADPKEPIPAKPRQDKQNVNVHSQQKESLYVQRHVRPYPTDSTSVTLDLGLSHSDSWIIVGVLRAVQAVIEVLKSLQARGVAEAQDSLPSRLLQAVFLKARLLQALRALRPYLFEVIEMQSRRETQPTQQDARSAHVVDISSAQLAAIEPRKAHEAFLLLEMRIQQPWREGEELEAQEVRTLEAILLEALEALRVLEGRLTWVLEAQEALERRFQVTPRKFEAQQKHKARLRNFFKGFMKEA